MYTGVKAQTIKQAKASYTARGRPSLTEKEERQLKRNVILEQRAERAREQEKHRTSAAKRRAERERKEAQEKQRLQLGSQRRCDRFGHKSSQYHLGAFLRVPSGKTSDQGHEVTEKGEEGLQNEDIHTENSDEEAFQDGGIDDEMLLDAFSKAPAFTMLERNTPKVPTSNTTLMPPPPVPRVSKDPRPARAGLYSATEEDLDSFWVELDTSTQIARELKADINLGTEVPVSTASSFGSACLDLTVEEMESLDPPRSLSPSETFSRPLMPQPPPPARIVTPPQQDQASSAPVRLLPIPTEPLAAIRGPFRRASSMYCSPELGFTMTQLETFIEDEVQLTQPLPT